ncbi:hypothetical protein C8Q73DRAFT_786824 [Cubamyces lactineus]|nr:hypothetical protein C8Q73DRAFT_786824 [Cubamyces lactineus]
MSWTPSVSPSDLHGFTNTRRYGYCNIAAVALLVYEACITLDREYKHIWKRKSSAATWLFLLNRYIVIALYIVDIPATFKIMDARFLPAFGEIITSTRHPPICRVGSVLESADTDSAFSTFRPLSLKMTKISSYDVSLTVVSRICLIVSDVLVLSVTWAKTFGIVRLAREHGLDTSLSVTKVLLRDGSTYFTVWTILNSLHIAGTYVDSIQYVTTFTEAFTSILVSRFILNLREVANAPDPVEDVEPGSDAYWHLLEESWHVADRLRADVSTLLAPLGAPLDHTFDCMVTYDSQPTAVESTASSSPDLREKAAAAKGGLIQMKSVGWMRHRAA